MRNILADKPRVTKFPVEFDPPPDDMVPLASSAEAAADDAANDLLQNGEVLHSNEFSKLICGRRGGEERVLPLRVHMVNVGL